MPSSLRKPALRIALLIVIVAVGFSLWGFFRPDSEPADNNESFATNKISVEQLVEKLLEGERILIFDLRSRSDYALSHIPDSISLPSYEISLKGDELNMFTDWEVTLICENECEDNNAVRDLSFIGFSNLSVLEGGYKAYEEADLGDSSQAQLIQADLVNLLQSIEVPQVEISKLQSALEADIFLIDVRTPYEFVAGFIPGAINIPLHSIDAASEKGLIPKDKEIYIYCRGGNRSPIAAQALIQKGHENVFDVKGGIEEWKNVVGELSIPKGDGSDLMKLIPVLEP